VELGRVHYDYSILLSNKYIVLEIFKRLIFSLIRFKIFKLKIVTLFLKESEVYIITSQIYTCYKASQDIYIIYACSSWNGLWNSKLPASVCSVICQLLKARCDASLESLSAMAFLSL
jgi:hypothetical protein